MLLQAFRGLLSIKMITLSKKYTKSFSSPTPRAHQAKALYSVCRHLFWYCPHLVQGPWLEEEEIVKNWKTLKKTIIDWLINWTFGKVKKKWWHNDIWNFELDSIETCTISNGFGILIWSGGCEINYILGSFPTISCLFLRRFLSLDGLNKTLQVEVSAQISPATLG